jgi:hypothetical protein
VMIKKNFHKCLTIRGGGGGVILIKNRILFFGLRKGADFMEKMLFNTFKRCGQNFLFFNEGRRFLCLIQVISVFSGRSIGIGTI